MEPASVHYKDPSHESMQLLALYPSEPESILSRDPEAQQALNRATQGPHVIFSLLKTTRYLG